MEILSGHLVAKPAFDTNRLFDDFTATLRSQGLLQKPEVRDFVKLKSSIALFAVSVMHNCKVVMPDGGKVKLLVNPGNDKNAPIAVSAMTEILDEDYKKRINASNLFLSSAIFSTEIGAGAGCASDLLEATAPWEFDIELTTYRKLDRLG